MAKKSKKVAIGFTLDTGKMQRIVIPERTYTQACEFLQKDFGAKVRLIYIISIE